MASTGKHDLALKTDDEINSWIMSVWGPVAQ